MATRRPSESAEESIENEDFTMSEDQKPKTGRELYKVLMENGLIGMWKDRTDMGDTLEYVQKMKDESRERRQERPRKHVQS